MNTSRFDRLALTLAKENTRRGTLRLLATGLVGLITHVAAEPARAVQLADSGPITCLASLTNCGGVCVLTQYDDQHCGACGYACLFWQMCREGVCIANPLNERG